MFSITTNYASLRSSVRYLQEAATNQSRSLSKLSGADPVDPTVSGSLAGYILKVRNNFSSTRMLESGLTNALSYLQIQAGAYERLQGAISRMSELVNTMRDVSKQDQDATLYVNEFNQMRDEIRSALQTDFNGKPVVDSSLSGPAPMEIQLTPDGKQKIYISQGYFGMDASSAYYYDTNWDWSTMTLGQLDFTVARTDPQGISTAVLDVVDQSFLARLSENISARFSVNTSQQAQVLDALDALRERVSTMSQAASQISDVNVAFEVARLNESTLRFHSAVASMTQSNVLADAALKVLLN